MIAAVIMAAAVAASSPAPQLLEPDVVVARYARTVRTYRAPQRASFSYTVEQDGPRGLDQTHRIYRSGNDERDETIAVEGRSLPRPTIRIFHGRRDRYALARLAPLRDRYVFTYAGTVPIGRHLGYRFTTRAKRPAPFTVEAVVIDGVRFLPVSLDFTSRSNRMKGRGSIQFTAIDRYCVPLFATALMRDARRPTRERIAWFSYRFPTSLPRSTFSTPRTVRTSPIVL